MKTYEIKKSEARTGFWVLEIGSKKHTPAAWYTETVEKAEEYKKYLETKVAARETEKAARRARRSAAKKAIVNPWKVGQLFHYSWGYDQTNCEFYEAVAVSAKTVTLRPIAGSTVPNSEGMMSDRRGPVQGAFLGTEQLVKPLQCHVDYYGKAGAPYVAMKFGSCSPCNPEDTFYCSWYA